AGRSSDEHVCHGSLLPPRHPARHLERRPSCAEHRYLPVVAVRSAVTAFSTGSNSRFTSTSSPVATPVACRLALLRPSRLRPRMIATLLRHECPLIVIITLGRLPPPNASTTRWGT